MALKNCFVFCVRFAVDTVPPQLTKILFAMVVCVFWYYVKIFVLEDLVP